MIRTTDADVIAAVVRIFDGEVEAVAFRDGVLDFPDELDGHRRTVHAFAPCADCAAGGWSRYEDTPLCRLCTWARWVGQWS